MKLAQLLPALATLYPQLRTRSGNLITTTEATGALTEQGPEALEVTVKTVFPPSDRRRSELVVLPVDGGFTIRPLDPLATTDAQRFAELVRARWATELGESDVLAPLCLQRDGENRYVFRVALEPPEPEPEIKTSPSTPDAKRSERESS